MQLQRAGNTRYFGWSVRFSCDKVNQIVLKKWLNRLNVALDCWNEQVKQARRKYYHLNNFTNKQLCAIRRVLCKAKFATTVSLSDIKPGIVAMLKSISAEISSSGRPPAGPQILGWPVGKPCWAAGAGPLEAIQPVGDWGSLGSTSQHGSR